MSFDERPELSVVVPVYNESATIDSLLETLAGQKGIRMELIISDGESGDGSAAEVSRRRSRFPFPLTLLTGPRGRAQQLNRGAEAARAATLLFLHADSRFPDPLALRQGMDLLDAASQSGRRAAGRFTLEFDFEKKPPLPYRFYAAKAALNRPGCTHGDQGFLIGSDFFGEVGPFDPALPLMEDTFLAERVREQGEWLLLPGRIRTSPRRFLAEGLLPRQILNAIISDLAALKRFDLIEELKGCYRSQDAAGKLELYPFLVRIRQWIESLPESERKRFWYATGSYVRSNAWQIPFFLDVLWGGLPEGEGGKFLALHDRRFARLLDNQLTNRLAAGLVFLWFKTMLTFSAPRCPPQA